MASGGFNLAFAGPARKARRIEIHENQDAVVREEVVGLTDQGLKTAGPAPTKEGPKVIPALPNTYRGPGRGYVPSFVPEAVGAAGEEGSIDKFETAAHDTAEAQVSMVYGLNKRERPAAEAGPGPQSSGGDAEAQALRKDLQELPEVASLEAYEAMPVEAFGEAMLRGMGWKEGNGLGKNGRDAPQPLELKRRPAGLGLGATAAPVPTQKRFIKPGESRVVQPAGPVDNKAATKTGAPTRRVEALLKGQEAWVAEGPHAGLACQFLTHEPNREGRSARARVCLLPSNETVVVRLSELSLTKPEPTDKKNRRGHETPSYPGREHADDPGSHRRGPEGSRPWLAPNIRVKIIDKRVEKGRVYLKKGTIVDVTSPQTCDVHVDDPRITVQDLRQSQLETVVPSREGASLLILVGKHRGRHAVLLRRNTEAGVAAVRLAGDLEASVLRLSLDDIAEYVGTDHGDDGH